jgi:hypothetical protein
MTKLLLVADTAALTMALALVTAVEAAEEAHIL